MARNTKRDASDTTRKQLRYTAASGPENEHQPKSRGRVLRNLKGIHLKREMDREEVDALVRVQERYLAMIDTTTTFSVELICRMHQDWLGDLYEWAGRFRTVELTKAGFTWPPAYLVERNMRAFEREVLKKRTPCVGMKAEQVYQSMAEAHAELLLIHPFRDGNGRLARWLVELMALQAGLPLPIYRFTGRGSRAESARYLSAVKRGYLKDYRPLADFFRTTLERAMVPE